MSSGGEAADQMVREGIQITEAAVKLSALGAKNIAAIAMALAKENPKVRGRTRLNRILRDGRELKVFQIPSGKLGEFQKQAKHYGVLFSAIRNRDSKDGLTDILARAEDVSKLNRIFQRMGYAVPEQKETERKKATARRPSENDWMTRGHGAMETGQTVIDRKPSVRETLRRFKTAAEKQAARARTFAEKELAAEKHRADEVMRD